jgi:tRNA nucleotidyltransferase (CCA-adding enzyme)
VTFSASLKEDLSRRDFTINALAFNNEEGLIDYFNGQDDIKKRKLKTVGEPEKRFSEDALRMLRAIRFACIYDLKIEIKTYSAIQIHSELIAIISHERIRDELCKILTSTNPAKGINLLKDTGLLHYILPEVEDMIGFDQRTPHHHKDVYQHTLIVLESVPNNLVLRLAALFHDIAKPLTFTKDEQGYGHFYGHHLRGETLVEEVLRRLKFDNDTVGKVCVLVREHMSRYANLKRASIKKLINRVGVENLDSLFLLQIADIKGSAPPHDFSKILTLQADVNKILIEKEPLTVRDLAINGRDLMDLGITPGKKMGQILGFLLEKVLERPELNHKGKLLEIVNSIKMKL